MSNGCHSDSHDGKIGATIGVSDFHGEGFPKLHWASHIHLVKRLYGILSAGQDSGTCTGLEEGSRGWFSLSFSAARNSDTGGEELQSISSVDVDDVASHEGQVYQGSNRRLVWCTE